MIEEIRILNLVTTFPSSRYMRAIKPLVEIDVENSDLQVDDLLSKIPPEGGFVGWDTMGDLKTVIKTMIDPSHELHFEVFDVIRFYARGLDILSINFPANSTGKGVFINLDLYKRVRKSSFQNRVSPYIIPVIFSCMTALVYLWPVSGISLHQQ